VSGGRFVVPYKPIGTTYGPAEIEALLACISAEDTLSCGPQRDAFEREFAELVGARHAVSVTNCTVALELATYLCDLRPGDEVIATCQSYQATTTPLLCGPATVRFADVDPMTLNISPDAIERLLTSRTRAIFLVHYGGEMADLTAISELVAGRNIVIVEDCAHALGASRDGVGPGSTAGIGCFSFQSYKNISTLGEGGMLTTNNDDWAERLRRIRSIEPDATYRARASSRLGPHRAPSDGVLRHEKDAYTADCIQVRHPGTNSTLPEPAAAVGRVQLGRLGELVARRTAIATALDGALREIHGVTVQERPAKAPSAHHLYTFFVEPSSRVPQQHLLGALLESGIEIQQRYFPIHLLAEWRRLGNNVGQCPRAEQTWFERQVNLPIYPQLTDHQLNYMIDTVTTALRP
jgi:perosamine synthetase